MQLHQVTAAEATGKQLRLRWRPHCRHSSSQTSIPKSRTDCVWSNSGRHKAIIMFEFPRHLSKIVCNPWASFVVISGADTQNEVFHRNLSDRGIFLTVLSVLRGTAAQRQRRRHVGCAADERAARVRPAAAPTHRQLLLQRRREGHPRGSQLLPCDTRKRQFCNFCKFELSDW